MTEKSAITEGLRNRVGVEEQPEVFEVEKGHIRRFAEAVGDPNPLFQDEEYARKSRYGGIIAPPTFLQDQALMKLADKLFTLECQLPKVFNGGSEYEWYQPMKLGDIITTRAKLADLYEKQRKSGTLLFFIIETSFTNQRGEPVARGRHTFIRM